MITKNGLQATAWYYQYANRNGDITIPESETFDTNGTMTQRKYPDINKLNKQYNRIRTAYSAHFRSRNLAMR